MVADPAIVARANQARALLDQYGMWIDKYKGGVPRGFAATIMLWESGGNFNAPGDPSLGEIGFYQVASYVPQMFGMDVSATADPESNVCIGLLEYQTEAVRWNLFTGGLVPIGSADSYRLARMTFALGQAGGRQMATLAQASTPGDVYGDIARYVAANGAPAQGSVAGTKVAQRVLDIGTQWAIAELCGDNTPGPPTIVPDPPAGPYTLPADVAPLFSRQIPSIAIILGGLAILGYALYKRRYAA